MAKFKIETRRCERAIVEDVEVCMLELSTDEATALRKMIGNSSQSGRISSFNLTEGQSVYMGRLYDVLAGRV